MAKKRQTLLKKAYNGFLQIDLFGETVGFSIDGQDTYKSILGAILSFFMASACLAYFIDNYISMIQFGQTTYQKDEVYYNTIQNEENINYNLTKFTAAFVV